MLVAQSAPSSRSTANARFGSSSAKSTAPPPLPDGAPQITDEPIDIEARLGILVEDVSRSASQVTALVAQHGGTVTLDLRTEKSSEDAGEARLQVRVPAPRFDSFFDAVTQVGSVRGREIKKRDVELEIHDTDLLLRNLEATMRRYEEILGQAHDVKDVLAIENELNRVRADIDQTKGRLAWLRDRVARATVVIQLSSPTRKKPKKERRSSLVCEPLRSSICARGREPNGTRGAGSRCASRICGAPGRAPSAAWSSISTSREAAADLIQRTATTA